MSDAGPCAANGRGAAPVNLAAGGAAGPRACYRRTDFGVGPGQGIRDGAHGDCPSRPRGGPGRQRGRLELLRSLVAAD